MKKLFTLTILFFYILGAKAQTRSYGDIDTADLKLTSCDFEKDASALVLFDKTDINTGFASTTILRHKRIKILNDKGKDEASIQLDYYSSEGLEHISDIIAETINLDNNKIQKIAVDQKSIYHQSVDRTTKRFSFTFPQVKVGSVIEYSYKLTIGFGGGFPDWNFQEDIPVRYCEFSAAIINDYSYKMAPRVYNAYTKNTTEPWISKMGDTLGRKYLWALSNVNSFREEPYSTSVSDDKQKIGFRLVAYKYTRKSELKSLEKPWWLVAQSLLGDEDFGLQMAEKLPDEDLIKKAKTLKDTTEMISFLFDTVKNNIKWDGTNRWYTTDGTKKAWDKKKGNSTEINLIVYRLLTDAGIKCFPELVSTRSNGRVNTSYASLSQFNKTIVNVPLPDKKSYLLDATEKYNNYSDIPFDVLNTTGMLVNREKNEYTLYNIHAEEPSKNVVFVNAEITPDGKMTGVTQINSFSYNKQIAVKDYETDGEQKYKNDLRDNDNGLKISSFKIENMKVDSLPLTQTIGFNLDLAGSDENYIYFNPNLFTGLNTNPLLNKERLSDINFKYLRNYVIDGRYKIADGYKIESLPKSQSLLMPDTSITFKRIVAEQEGYIIVHYVIGFKKSYYPKDEYPQLFAFYKKMHEMLNEQIILKKG